MIGFYNLKKWAKSSDGFPARALRWGCYGIRRFEFPSVRLLHGQLYHAHKTISSLIGSLMRVGYWTPLFASRLVGLAPQLCLDAGLPLITGPSAISIGRARRISAATTLSGRWSSNPIPRLLIGDNVGIGWQTKISVGSKVVFGNIILEDNVWLGTAVMVFAAVHIGAGAIVAAGSVVSADLEANVLAAGVPARVIRGLSSSEDRTNAIWAA